MGRPKGSLNKPKNEAEWSAKRKPGFNYWDCGEVISPDEAGKLLGVSAQTMYGFLRTGVIPGFKQRLEFGVHYFRSGSDYKIVKDQLCQLIGILPKSPHGVYTAEVPKPSGNDRVLLDVLISCLQGLAGESPGQTQTPGRAGDGGLRVV